MKYLILSFFILTTACLPVQAQDKFLDIQEVKSENGITAWLVEDHALPIISIKFAFQNAGSIQDGVEKQGRAKLLSNTLDEGAGDLTSQDFQKALSDHSITLSFGAGRDNFSGQLKTLSRHKEKAFELLKLSLTQPRFNEKPLERMRRANISRILSSMGNPDWIAARLFNDKAFEGHNYSLNSGGTLSTLENITADDLRTHLKNYLTQDRLHIGVMGDITNEELQDVLDDIFGGLPKTGKPTDVEGIELQNVGKTFVYDQDIPQTILSISMPSLDHKDPQFFDLRVMNYIFGGGGFGSRLMEEAREKRGLTYGIYSGLSNQNFIDLFNIDTSTKNESAGEMIDIINAEMQRLIHVGVTDQELEDAQSYLTGSLPLALTSTDKIANILLSLQLNERDITYLDSYADQINAVTKKDIQNVAKRILTPEKMLTIMVGQLQNIENIIKIEKLNNVE